MTVLSLGTAQWGVRYGLTNTRGELSDADVADIVETALSLGIASVDTHRTPNPEHGYGRALSRLRPWAGRFDITTKVFGGSSADLPVIGQIEATLTELDVPMVHACLVHDWSALSDAEAAAVAAGLRQAHEQGLVGAVGVSAYEEEELQRAERMFDDLGCVQVPCSVLDQRLTASDVAERLRTNGVETQVRSIFLQGLLLDPEARSPLATHPDVLAFHAYCATHSLDPLAACLAFVRDFPWADVVVVGVTSADELRQIHDGWITASTDWDWSTLASADVDLVDPRRWGR